ncbi:MAG: hypothetical protein CMO30_16760 [Tistrella sp.]|nr:hypothetical protein [Tistrella sp.]
MLHTVVAMIGRLTIKIGPHIYAMKIRAQEFQCYERCTACSSHSGRRNFRCKLLHTDIYIPCLMRRKHILQCSRSNMWMMLYNNARKFLLFNPSNKSSGYVKIGLVIHPLPKAGMDNDEGLRIGSH